MQSPIAARFSRPPGIFIAGLPQKFEAIARHGLKSVFAQVRDAWNEHSFRGFGAEPVYSGVYASHHAALASLPRNAFVGFDDPAITDFYVQYHFGLNPYDYPVLFWLGQVYSDGCTVFDFGGGLGQCRYAYEPFLRRSGHLPETARWTVCDLPAFVQRGQQLAAEKGMADLRFTGDLGAASDAGIFITNGALQYLAEDLPQLFAGLRKMPEHVLINRVPVTAGPAYYTVQRTRHRSYAPYRVMNREEFIQGMRSLGYRLDDSWEVPRTLHVNFRPECDLLKYSGFYFRREAHGLLQVEAERAAGRTLRAG